MWLGAVKVLDWFFQHDPMVRVQTHQSSYLLLLVHEQEHKIDSFFLPSFTNSRLNFLTSPCDGQFDPCCARRPGLGVRRPLF
jgi:hypothetical protein